MSVKVYPAQASPAAIAPSRSRPSGEGPENALNAETIQTAKSSPESGIEQAGDRRDCTTHSSVGNPHPLMSWAT